MPNCRAHCKGQGLYILASIRGARWRVPGSVCRSFLMILPVGFLRTVALNT